jgi:hypothetical protein
MKQNYDGKCTEHKAHATKQATIRKMSSRWCGEVYLSHGNNVLGWQQLQPEMNELWSNVFPRVSTIQALGLFASDIKLLHLLVHFHEQRDSAKPVLVPPNRLKLEKRHCIKKVQLRVCCVAASKVPSVSSLVHVNGARFG